MSKINCSAINAVTELLKIEHKMKRDLIDLLANNFTHVEVDKAIHDAVSLRFIKQTGLIKSRNHEQTMYRLIRFAV